MNKFLCKISFLLIPLFILSVNYIFYERSGGDLNRLGKISIKTNYREIFGHYFTQQKKYKNLSEVDLNKTKHINILTIGDSFSQQGNYGYQNNLSIISNLSIINMQINKYYKNQFQMLFSLVNGDLLDKVKIDYIILQSVERNIGIKYKQIDKKQVLTLKNIQNISLNTDNKEIKEDNMDLGIFKDMMEYLMYNIFYKFDKRAYISQSYKMKLTKNLFSMQENDLLFYYADIENITYSNKDTIILLNNELNAISKKLKNKGTKLIFLPSPDKYDIYYEFISKNDLPRNHFFEYLKVLKKDYLYINSKDILFSHISKGEKDIYFLDDTHWSPISSEIIAKEIFNKLKNKMSSFKRLQTKK